LRTGISAVATSVIVNIIDTPGSDAPDFFLGIDRPLLAYACVLLYGEI